MIKNRLGKSDIYISPLSFGCMSLETEKNQAKSIIDYALDHGINHLDTADLYQFGKNEEMIGEIIKPRRKDIILTTKVGNHFDSKKQTWYWDPSKIYIKSAINSSLKRLQTDYIDLYLLHGGTIHDPIDETIEAFEQLKKAGKIRAYGISSIRPNVIKEYMNRSNIDVIMMQYSLLDRRPEEFLDTLLEKKISVLARGPLAKGMLSNRAKEYLQTKGKDGFLAYNEKKLKQTIEKLFHIGNSMNQLAFQYVNDHPAVASAVFGARTMEQLKENVQFIDLPQLSEKEIKELKQITKFFRYDLHR